MSDERPPDFAMARAVEVLASIYERQKRAPEQRPPPLDRVVQLFSETISFDVTKTTRAQVERALGLAFAYPSHGWHTYCVRGAPATGREFASLFFSRDALVSVELYLPRTPRAPTLEPREIGRLRLVPGEICIGMPLGSLPDGFARMRKPEGLGPYADIFQAAFPGGAAYAMGNAGTIERLALYALR